MAHGLAIYWSPKFNGLKITKSILCLRKTNKIKMHVFYYVTELTCGLCTMCFTAKCAKQTINVYSFNFSLPVAVAGQKLCSVDELKQFQVQPFHEGKREGESANSCHFLKISCVYEDSFFHLLR